MEADAGRARWGYWGHQSQHRGLNRTTGDPLSGAYSLPDASDAKSFPQNPSCLVSEATLKSREESRP